MIQPPDPPLPAVVDNVILARFVDAGQANLLAQLAGGRVLLTPTIFNPDELPPFHRRRPKAEFNLGIYAAEQKTPPTTLHIQRFQRRTTFIQTQRALWRLTDPILDELRHAQYLASGDAVIDAIQRDPSYRDRIVDPGEAECAAIAIARNLPLCTDDRAIVDLLRVLHPDQIIETSSQLITRAVQTSFIECQFGANLYNEIFIKYLGITADFRLDCRNGAIIIVR